MALPKASTCRFEAQPKASTMLDGCSVAGRVQVCSVLLLLTAASVYPRTDPHMAPVMPTCLDQRTLSGQTYASSPRALLRCLTLRTMAALAGALRRRLVITRCVLQVHGANDVQPPRHCHAPQTPESIGTHADPGSTHAAYAACTTSDAQLGSTWKAVMRADGCNSHHARRSSGA